MPRRDPTGVLAFALALLLAACAQRTERSNRDAWSAAMQGNRDRGSSRGSGDADKGAGTADDLAAWTDVGAALVRIGEELAYGVATVDFDRLARELCGQPVEASVDAGRRVYHCEPTPVLLLLSETLEIELDDTGVVALVAADVNEEESATLQRRALLQLKERCVEPWTALPRDAENAHEEFHTCPLASGPRITVGRFPRDLAANRWQFTLVVLGPG